MGALTPSADLPVRVIDLGLAGALRSQAVYHAVAQGMTCRTPDTVILVRPRDPYLCLGWHDALAAVLDVEVCAREALPIVRRRVGGGTTYLDSAQPFYQFVFHHTRVPALARDLYATLLAAPVQALRRLGFPAELRDTNEIEVGGRRIAGVGGGRLGEAAVVVGNVLCDFDFSVLPRVWNAPWPRFRELAAQALRDRLTTLRALGGPSHPDVVSAAVRDCLSAALARPIEPGTLSPDEASRAQQLEGRLSAAEFLALHSERGGEPMRRLKISAGVFIHGATARLGAATLRLTLRERDGTIESARIEDESGADWAGAAAALAGAPIAGWRERLAEGPRSESAG